MCPRLSIDLHQCLASTDGSVKPAVFLTLRTFCRLTWSNFSLSNFSLIHFSLSETTTATERAPSHLPPGRGVCVGAIWHQGQKQKSLRVGESEWESERSVHTYIHISALSPGKCELVHVGCAFADLDPSGSLISCFIQVYSASLIYIGWSFHTEVSKCRCHRLCVPRVSFSVGVL